MVHMAIQALVEQVVLEEADLDDLLAAVAAHLRLGKDKLVHQLFHRHILILVEVVAVHGMPETILQVTVEKD
jgi:hypothetical protein